MLSPSVDDLVLHHEWIRDRHVFSVLKKLVVFKRPAVFYAFRKWNSSVCDERFQRNKERLQSKLLFLSPAYGQALMRVHKVISNVWDDPANRWLKTTEGGSSEAYTAYQQHLAALGPVVHGAKQSEASNSSQRKAKTSRPQASSRWSLRAPTQSPFKLSTDPNSTAASGGHFTSSTFKRVNTLSFEDQQSASVTFLTVSNVVKSRKTLLHLDDNDSFELEKDSEVSFYSHTPLIGN